jgi:hypothetical protein
MTTYRLGFCAFGELTVGVGQPGHARIAPGETLAVVGTSPVLTPLLVAVVGPGAQVAGGSVFGDEGQPVTVDCRLTVVSDSPNSSGLTLDVLSLDGTPVGLLGGGGLQLGVTYIVTEVTEVDGLTALRSHGVSDNTAWEAVFCFTLGTLVDTPDGPRLIEALEPGDLVTTMGNGSQRLRWTGSRHVPVAEMLQIPDLQPVEFAAGAIGNARPLRVSPQHRILLNDWRAQVFFGEDEVLIPAKAMLNGGTIRQILPAGG